ncbi:hypothetical protein AB6D85_17565 [Vibrio splendidus]
MKNSTSSIGGILDEAEQEAKSGEYSNSLRLVIVSLRKLMAKRAKVKRTLKAKRKNHEC